MPKCDKSTYENKVEAVLIPNNNNQIVMTVSANNRRIDQEHVSCCNY